MGSNDKDIVRGCQKFQENYKYYNDTEKDAIIYLRLRKEGCPKKPALSFSSKTVCRSDSTRTVFGPTNYRMLKIKPNPNYSIQKGWLQGNLAYKMDKDYFTSYKDIIQEDNQDDNLQNIFDSNEDEAKQEFKKMLEVMKEYFDDISAQFQLKRGNSNSEYLQNIKKLIEETRQKLKSKTYFEYRNVKFYYLSQLLKQILDQEKQNPLEKEGIIRKFNIFNEVLNEPDIKNLELKQEDCSHDESFFMISPQSKNKKKQQGYQSSKQNRNSKNSFLNRSYEYDNSSHSQKSACSPKIQSICGSSDNGLMYDITQEGEISKQSSIPGLGLGYMTDSIQSCSQEDGSISSDSDSPRSTYKGEQNHKPSIIVNAALQLQVLQQMDMTNQDLFSGSTPKGVQSQRHSHIPGNSINQRILEQSFNQAQYFYQNEKDKKKSEKKKKKTQIIVQTSGSSQTIVDEDSKRKKQNKIQNILKLDSDVENVFQSLLKTVTNYQDNKEAYKNAKELYQPDNNEDQILSNTQVINLQSPLSPGAQKSIFFKRDFQSSSKTPTVESNSKPLNKVSISISVNGTSNQDTIKTSDSNADSIQNKFINNTNLNWLVGQKNQMMDTFVKRNYRNSSNDSLNRLPFLSFKDRDTSLTRLSTAQTTHNFFHHRHNSYTFKPSSLAGSPQLSSQQVKDQLYVKVNPLMSNQSKQARNSQSTAINNEIKIDPLDLNDNNNMNSQQIIQKRLMRLTSSMAQGVDMNQKRLSTERNKLNKTPLTQNSEYYTPITTSRKSKQSLTQASQTQSSFKNFGSPINKMQFKIK